MARSSACLDFLLLSFSSDSIAFPFYFSLFFPASAVLFSSNVHWRMKLTDGGRILSASCVSPPVNIWRRNKPRRREKREKVKGKGY